MDKQSQKGGIYLTELFPQGASRHSKETCLGCCGAEYPHLLHAVFSFCHLHNGCKKLLKVVKDFRDLLTRT